MGAMDTNDKAAPSLSELVAYIKEHGASEAARHFGIGYATVRAKAKLAGLRLRRGRRRDRQLAARNADIRVLRMQGCYLRSIGDQYGLGRERVRQILQATGGDPLRDLEDPETRSPFRPHHVDMADQEAARVSLPKPSAEES